MEYAIRSEIALCTVSIELHGYFFGDPQVQVAGQIGRQAQTHARADMTSLKKNLLQNKLVFYAPWRSKFAKIRKKHNGVYDLK